MVIRGLLLWIVLMLSWPAVAGPAEDYEAGAKAFSAANMVDAMTFLRKAADKGHAEAQALLAFILEGADLLDEAALYYRKSADQGNAEGQYGLAAMYATGKGVQQDLKEARRLAVLAAGQGNKSAIMMMAEAYLVGGLGVDGADRTGAEALSWIKQAAETDYLPALVALAAAYGTGQYGLEVDPKMVASLNGRIQAIREKTKAESLPQKK